MARNEDVADQLRRAFEGEAWHGPALLELLSDVDAKTAATQPIAQAHSIWELILHLICWHRVIMRRMTGEALMPSDQENFPAVSDSSDNAWRKALDDLQRSNKEMLAKVSSMTEQKLREQVPGKDYDFYFMLHGAIQHVLYHAGQIAILKKAATRS